MPLRRWLGAFGALLPVCLCVAACSGTPMPPHQSALRAAHRASVTAVERGVESTRAAAPFVLPARLNPPRSEGCDCPPFEVRYEGSWHRVIVQSNAELMVRLDGLVGTREEIIEGVWWFVGAPLDETALWSEGGQRFAVFELDELRPVHHAPPAKPGSDAP